MKILYIGTPEIHDRWLKGENPSHWMYGACEMERDGHEVIWETERKTLTNDIRLIYKCNPDIVFVPNLNLKAHVLLLVLSAVGLLRNPIYAYLHHEPRVKHGVKSMLYKFMLSGVKHLFFLSEKSMEETIKNGLAKAECCSVPGWGHDEEFFSKVQTCDKGYFISTGKENRDFDILIEAFKRTGAPLKIMTAGSHAGNDHTGLIEKCKDISNIEVVITENTGAVYPMMLKAMAEAKALVCPLRKDKLNYCVGLSTIADAEGLKKPLIITRNPYHSKERTKNFAVVETVEDWCDAIKRIQGSEGCPLTTSYSMQRVYEKIKRVMFR